MIRSYRINYPTLKLACWANYYDQRIGCNIVGWQGLIVSSTASLDSPYTCKDERCFQYADLVLHKLGQLRHG